MEAKAHYDAREDDQPIRWAMKKQNRQDGGPKGDIWPYIVIMANYKKEVGANHKSFFWVYYFHYFHYFHCFHQFWQLFGEKLVI